MWIFEPSGAAADKQLLHRTVSKRRESDPVSDFLVPFKDQSYWAPKSKLERTNPVKRIQNAAIIVL